MDRRVQNQEPELLSWVIPAMFVVEVRKVSNRQQNQDKVHKTQVWENMGGGADLKARTHSSTLH